jgi:hypothetical protein
MVVPEVEKRATSFRLVPDVAGKERARAKTGPSKMTKSFEVFVRRLKLGVLSGVIFVYKKHELMRLILKRATNQDENARM